MVKRLAHAHPEELVAQEKRGNAATVACHCGRVCGPFLNWGFDEQEDTSGGGG
jgi:hypothetical protein